MASDSGSGRSPGPGEASESASAPVIAEGMGALMFQTGPNTDTGHGHNTSDGLDEVSALKNLASNVLDQDDLERDISNEANLALIASEDKKDERRIEKAQANIVRLEAQKKTQQERFRKAIGKTDVKQKIREEIARIDADIELNDKDIADFHARIEQRHQEGEQASQAHGGNQKLPNESHREFLIRTGKITPFANIGRPCPEGVDGELANALVEAEDEAAADELEETAGYEPRSHQNLRVPGFAEDPDVTSSAAESEFSLRPRKKRKLGTGTTARDEDVPEASDAPEAAFVVEPDEESEDYDMTERPAKKAKKASSHANKLDVSKLDDGNELSYQKRLDHWVDRRSRARLRRQQQTGSETSGGTEDVDQEAEEEWFKPSPDQADHQFDNGLKLPGDIFPALFDYQKTGVQWLAELYSQKVGGIIGDEMGLGKTVQLISFVAALHYSKRLDKPVIVVAPATVLQQWVNEFHRWWPPLRVSILHSSGSGMLNIRSEGALEDEEVAWNRRGGERRVNKAAKKIVDRVVAHGHVLVTTYAGLQTYGDLLIPVHWGYAVLDEGHKIRNPNTAITIYCKELRTPNRVILSGTPMQNNLMELWSLFDFVFPMRLGTLVDFRNQFEIPIKIGGYANASNLQIMTAQKCAETLKDAISPYLLQRYKIDVAADLPKKREQVIFCKLTPTQRSAYELFLGSDERVSILNGTRQALYGINILRKICNHPDLVDPRLKTRDGYEWGLAERSGKMQVIKGLLEIWKRLGHKTLLFSQGVQMLDILERFVGGLDNIRYLRMDGSTPIKERQRLVDSFNNDPDMDLFLLTTKVGGLGVNLTGANRVIIFDPDWNPSTDIQARERAWRLGQKKEVTIYRLMTAGTIEEKVLHTQIYKQFLSNKVLKDPKQRSTLTPHDMHDLFTLAPEDATTETGRMFEGSEVQIKHESRAQNPPAPATRSTPADLDGGDHGQQEKPAAPQQEEQQQHGGDQSVGTLSGVARLEEYQYQTNEEAAGAAGTTGTDEDRITKGIFASSGVVHSALEHDKIIDGRRQPQANREMLRAEADRVAAGAAAALRRAGEQARRVPIGTVTWTGEVGEGGRPGGPPPRPSPSRPSNMRRQLHDRGLGSSAVLAGLASRQGRSPTPTVASTPPPDDFHKMIPAFIRRHGGRGVPTKVLVDHFNRYCGSRAQVDAFKAALARVAVLEKAGPRMRSLWALRQD
ncbi:SNF2 family N-terminal domain-containing protein [Xylariaceae sp. FL0804]|nr:SNF2 family N-terminal domain-containing protein [Xylariaceae sp. FL0804]